MWRWISRLSGSAMLAALAAVAFGGRVGVAEDWRQFRGDRGTGRVAGASAPENWNSFRNVVWETHLPGVGCSSPIVLGDRIWLTASETVALTTQERDQRAQETPLASEDLQFQGAVTAYALEIDGKSGRLLRRIRLFERDAPPPIHIWNQYSSPTPTTDGRRVYCHFGSLGTAAVEIESGAVAWQRRLEVEETTGPGSSPILWRDRLLVPCDGRDRQFLAALDVQTGRELWRTNRPSIDAVDDQHKRAFSTPLIIPDRDGDVVVSVGAQWLTAYDPETGREKWRVNFGAGYSVVPMPVYRDGVIFACTGYPKPQLWAVRTGGRGDVTETHVAWIYDRQVPELASPIVVGDLLYLASLAGVVSCLDADTGERLWQQRLEGGFHASPIAVGERIFFTSRDGATTVIKAGREFQVVGRGQATGIHQATPAVFDGGLVFRSSQGLYFVRERK